MMNGRPRSSKTRASCCCSEVPERTRGRSRAAQKAGAIVVQDCGVKKEMSDEHLARCVRRAERVGVGSLDWKDSIGRMLLMRMWMRRATC